MAQKFIIDFHYNEKTGEPAFFIDYNDDSLTQFELHQAVHDGEIRQQILGVIAALFGPDMQQQVAAGQIPLICLDQHPEERPPELLNPLPALPTSDPRQENQQTWS